MFYIYEWYVVETGEVIYVGKGTRNRYKNKKKNALLNKLLEVKNCEVRIIEWYRTEKEAFEAERKRIVFLKDMGQAVCNKISYSTGGVASIWTEEKRRYMSEHNPMKREEQRERMSRCNPMRNPSVAERVGMTKRKPILIGDKVFSCAQDAALEFGVSDTTIRDWVKAGKRKSTGEKCEYIKREEKNPPEIKTQILSHSIIYDGKEFDTAKDAAEYANVKDTSTIHRWCRKGYSPNGVSCRYKDDDAEHTYIPPNKAHTNKKVVVDGVIYNSIKDAAEKLGVSYYVFRHRIPYTEYKQDNQQPSHEKSNNSIVEGSETNE